jgi:DNA-binding protein HU-beta
LGLCCQQLWLTLIVPETGIIIFKFKGKYVNKSELIEAIAASADLPKAAAGRALDAMVDSITDALKADDQVVLVGFGTFTVKDRAARTGRNPQTGAPIQIAAAKVPGFKAGKALKDAVN